jgi:hypothetical protein
MRAAQFGYAAAAWAFVFALMSFYWGLGGRAGIHTLGPGLAALANDPWFVALGLWGAGIAKVIGGLVALALVRPWGRAFPRRLLLIAAWVGGGGALLYGTALFIQHGLMLAGILAIPAGLGPVAARWHLLLWDPWWVSGGLLFVVTAKVFSLSVPKSRTKLDRR